MSPLVLEALFLAAVANPAAPATTETLLDSVVGSRIKRAAFEVTPSATLATTDAAYRFQDRLAAAETPRLGPVVGYKVGYASKAAQQQFGMDQPARGPLFLSQAIVSGSKRQAGEFREIMLETEIAFTLATAVTPDEVPATVDELRPYVRSVHAALDASDYRFNADAKPAPIDMIATGLGAHRYVLGRGVPPQRVDTQSLRLLLYRDGELVRDSPATEVMGDPWNSLLWLVRDVTSRGGSLPAGAIVLTGTADKAWKVTGDEVRGEYVGDCGPLGKVRLNLR
ncbi:2-keto-4-pentenoate hydratase [Planctomycetes bacterium MalM25]|nr:2-keto-4-pentenoate hydratase [Planctomycetes bacterium MalM25]